MSLVRVTVATATQEADLALPGSLPVAELLPELARQVGLLDQATAHNGYLLRTVAGRPLSGETGLTSQGVVDGAWLTVDAAAAARPPKLYDDVVEAMADAIEREFSPVGAGVLQWIGIGSGVLLLLLGAASLARLGDANAGLAAALVASALVAAAVALTGRRAGTTFVLAWVAVVYGAVAGLGLTSEMRVPGARVAGAGVCAAIVGMAALVGIREHRVLLVPAVIVGGVHVAGGLTIAATGIGAAEVMAAVAVLMLVGASFVPSLALAAAEAAVAGRHRRPDVVDEESVRATAVAGHRILLTVTSSVGLLVVVAAPVAVSLGGSGASLAVVAAVFLMLSVRQSRAAGEVLVGIGCGVVALASTTVAVLWQHPEWASWTSMTLVVLGAGSLALASIPSASPRRARAAEVAEVLALVALLPLLALATLAGGLGPA